MDSILVLAAALLHAQAVNGTEVAWQLGVPENGQMPATQSDGVLTQFRYSPYAVGDNVFVSRPHRHADTSNLATGWRVTRKDSAGRLTEVRHYSGNVLPDLAVAATAGRDSSTYDGTTTIVTDADSKVRHERRDALGRIALRPEWPFGVTAAPKEMIQYLRMRSGEHGFPPLNAASRFPKFHVEQIL